MFNPPAFESPISFFDRAQFDVFTGTIQKIESEVETHITSQRNLGGNLASVGSHQTYSTILYIADNAGKEKVVGIREKLFMREGQQVSVCMGRNAVHQEITSLIWIYNHTLEQWHEVLKKPVKIEQALSKNRASLNIGCLGVGIALLSLPFFVYQITSSLSISILLPVAAIVMMLYGLKKKAAPIYNELTLGMAKLKKSVQAMK